MTDLSGTARDSVTRRPRWEEPTSTGASALLIRERGAHTFGVPMPKAWEAVGCMGAEDPLASAGRS
jgi:hypothetical protein